VVDCERHVVIDKLEDLFPYLDATWLHRLTASEFRLPPKGPHPGLQVEGRRIVGDTTPQGLTASLAESVERVVLVPAQTPITSGWLSHEMSQVFCSAVNDHVVDAWLPADERAYFAIAVQAHDAELAATEIRRLGNHPSAAAVLLSAIRVALGQRHYDAIYEAAEALDLPVMLHPGGFEGTVVGPAELGGVGPYTPEEVVSLMPQVAASNVASLIYNGVFTRFPRLRVVIAGFGFTWAVSFLWRADAEWRNLRGEVPWLTQSPSDVVARSVRFVVDGAADIPAHAEALRLVEMLPSSALVWGSDEPYVQRAPEDVLGELPEELAARIVHENGITTFSRLAGVGSAT
jgi:hypothetical protein